MSKISNPTKVITGVNTRWSYANVWDAKSINGGTPKYSVSLIIPKSDTVTVNKIKAAIAAAYEEGQSKLKDNGKTVPALSVLKTPLRDGDLAILIILRYCSLVSLLIMGLLLSMTLHQVMRFQQKS